MELTEDFEEPKEEPPGYLNHLYEKGVNYQYYKNAIVSVPYVKNKINKKLAIQKKILGVSYYSNGNYFKILFSDNSSFKVKYPLNILSKIPIQDKKAIIDNFVYCKTSPLKLIYKLIAYGIDKVYLEGFINSSVISDIPRLGVSGDLNYLQLSKSFMNSRVSFLGNSVVHKLNIRQNTFKKKAILSFSFGKDSLLTYALLKELGIKYKLVSFDVGIPNERKVKSHVIKNFLKEQKEKLILIQDDTDLMLTNKRLGHKMIGFDFTNGLLSFSLEIFPLSYRYKCRYIIFGNQKDFDSYRISRQGKKIYQSSDQSSGYMNIQNKYIKKFSNNNIEIISIIKPIYDISIYKIISHRYPKLLKYLISCEASHKRWCCNCSTCAEYFLFLSCFDGVKKIGMKDNMFQKKQERHFILFTKKDIVGYSSSYPPVMRDQQLLAFLICYRKKYKGYLINKFKREYYKEAVEREKELRKRFFGAFSHSIIPKHFKNKLLNIYEEELSNLR